MIRPRAWVGGLAAALAAMSATAGLSAPAAAAGLTIWSMAPTPLQQLWAQDYSALQRQYARAQRLYEAGAKTD